MTESVGGGIAMGPANPRPAPAIAAKTAAITPIARRSEMPGQTPFAAGKGDMAPIWTAMGMGLPVNECSGLAK